MSYYRNDPRIIKAKFDSKCDETGKPIKRGEYCVYYPLGKKVFHESSKTAYEYRCWKADIDMGYNY